MRWNLLRNTSARAYLPTGPTLVVWGQCLDSDCGTAEALYVEDSEATPHIDFSWVYLLAKLRRPLTLALCVWNVGLAGAEAAAGAVRGRRRGGRT
jgi:hypothetical protein